MKDTDDLLVEGLPEDEVFQRAAYHARGRGVSDRALGFYLLEVERRRLHKSLGYSSTMAYAELVLGLKPRETRELLRVARALDRLPLIDQAYARSEIVWTKVREITRIATETTEEAWLRLAKEKTASQVQLAVSQAKRGECPTENALDARPAQFRFYLELPADVHQRFQKVLAKIRESSEKKLSPVQAFDEMCRLVQSLEPDGTVEGWKPTGQPTDAVVYHHHSDSGLTTVQCEEGEVAVPREAAEEAARRGPVLHVKEPEDPGDVPQILFGERGSVPPEERDRPTPPWLRSRVFAREGHRCAVCHRDLDLRAHHWVAVGNGGPTSEQNLVAVCVPCHSLIHTGLLQIRMVSGRIESFDRDGNPLHKKGGLAAQLDPDAEEFPLRVIEKRVESRADHLGSRNTLSGADTSSRDGQGGGAESETIRQDAPPSVFDRVHVRNEHYDPEGSCSVFEKAAELSGGAPDDPDPSSTPAGWIQSVNEIPDQITAAEWKQIIGLLDWSPSRKCYVLARRGFLAEALLPPDPDGARRNGPAIASSPQSPLGLADFVGQPLVIRSLTIALEAARHRGDPLAHVLLAGPAGLGKTTLAHLLAQELGVGFRPTAAPVIETPAQLVGLLVDLRARDILFIDEIHGLGASCEEFLYSALQGGYIDVIVAQGAERRSVRIALEPFTLLGATTRPGAIRKPLRDRFGLMETLEPYGQEDLRLLVERAAGRLDVRVSDDAAVEIARRSRETPREALRMLGRARDVAHSRKTGQITREHVLEASDLDGIDAEGLRREDRKLLGFLIDRGGPIGLRTLSDLMGTDPETILHVLEPFLLRNGFLRRTWRGRIATEKARARYSPTALRA